MKCIEVTCRSDLTKFIYHQYHVYGDLPLFVENSSEIKHTENDELEKEYVLKPKKARKSKEPHKAIALKKTAKATAGRKIKINIDKYIRPKNETADNVNKWKSENPLVKEEMMVENKMEETRTCSKDGETDTMDDGEMLEENDMENSKNDEEEKTLSTIRKTTTKDSDLKDRKLALRQEDIRERKEALLLDLVIELEKAENGDLYLVKELLRKRYTPESAPIYGVADLNKGKYECWKCKYKFLWKCHLDIHHTKYPHCSPDEKYEVTDKEALKEEVTFIHQETEVEITATLQSLYEAQQKAPYGCIICEKTTYNLETFKQHLISSHKKTQMYKCVICGQSLQTEGSLSTHLKQHFLCQYECPTCTWRFSVPMHLDKHKRNGCGHISLLDNSATNDSHMGSEYKCSVCKVEVSGLQTFQQHLQMAHQDEQGGFECNDCGHVSTRLHLYKEHIRQHLGNYPCPVSRYRLLLSLLSLLFLLANYYLLYKLRGRYHRM